MSSDNTTRRRVFRPGDKIVTEADASSVETEIEKLGFGAKHTLPIIGKPFPVASSASRILRASLQTLREWQRAKKRRPMAGAALTNAPPVAGSAAFDPSSLALTGWFRDFVNNAGQSGVASTGTSGSGSNDLSDNTSIVSAYINPISGTALDGHGTALISSGLGGNAGWIAEGTLDTYLNVKGSSGWALINPTANGYFFSSASLGFEVGFFSTGAQVTANNSAVVVGEAALGAIWLLVTWRYRSGAGNIEVGVNKIPGTGTPGTFAVSTPYNTNIGGLTDQLVIGCTALGAGGNFNGSIADIGISDQVFSDSDFTNIYAYAKARYPSAALP